MNEKLQYATMLEIPVNTCNVTLKAGKKRKIEKKKTRNLDEVKQELLNKINSEPLGDNSQEDAVLNQSNIYDGEVQEDITDVSKNNKETYELNNDDNTVNVSTVKKPNKRFKFSIVTTQFVIIGVLIATIFLTNAFYTDSGINVFFRSVFSGNQGEVVDVRTHDEFVPVLAVGDMTEITLDGGVMTFSGEGSVYSPCDGTITSVAKDGNGKYILEITHSENFKSVISGIDYAYAGLNDTVYSNIPVGYVNADGATMCFKGGDGTVISGYDIVDGSIVWAV